LNEKCKKLEETIQRVATNTKQIKSGLTRGTRKRTSPESEPSKPKPEKPRMLTN
jgi:hypothetical protein